MVRYFVLFLSSEMLRLHLRHTVTAEMKKYVIKQERNKKTFVAEYCCIFVYEILIGIVLILFVLFRIVIIHDTRVRLLI